MKVRVKRKRVKKPLSQINDGNQELGDKLVKKHKGKGDTEMLVEGKPTTEDTKAKEGEMVNEDEFEEKEIEIEQVVEEPKPKQGECKWGPGGDDCLMCGS